MICILFFFVSASTKIGSSKFPAVLISGKVSCEDDSSPLEGAIISVKGTKNVTGTMPDGAFSLELSAADTILLVSLSGYETKEIKINKETYYEISLKRAGGQHDCQDMVFRGLSKH